MYDPSTVAFEIKSPIVQRVHIRPDGKVWRYRKSIITIWHEDPEADGSDDSCGWAWPKASPADRELCKRLADDEFDFWLGQYYGVASGGIEFSARDIVWWAWKVIDARRRGRSLWKRPLSRGEENRISGLVCNPHDNIRRTIRDAGSKEGLESLFLCVDRLYRDFYRPWWRHPRWHVIHWRWVKFDLGW